MSRPSRAVGLAALAIVGIAASAGAGAVAVAGTETTEPVATTEPTDATRAPAPSLPAFEPDPIEWSSLGGGVEEGRLEVPMDYSDPDAGTFSLYLVRHLATDEDERIGSLLVNPGGPGFGGTYLAESAEFIFHPDLVERFDIVGWDPRGTARSEPAIDCIDDYDEYYAPGDITPDDEAERQELIDLAEGLTRECVENNEDFIQYVGTNNSARDMDTIRRALGEDQISYYGLSYGSELGGVWVTMFPDTVRAAVFDGAADPNADETEGGLQQIAGFERALETFLARCSDDSDCAFHNDGDAEGAFDELMSKLDAKPLPTVDGRPPVTRGVALQGVAEAMYNEGIWPELELALASALKGDGTGLLALYDSYYERRADGTWDNSLEAFHVIHCMDTPERQTIEEADALAPRYNEVAPRLAPGSTGSYMCTFFPEPDEPRGAITGAGAGPIVVCGVTGDASTPLESSRRMADALEDGRLIVVDANRHTCINADPCADDLIATYLVELEAPDEVTEC